MIHNYSCPSAGEGEQQTLIKGMPLPRGNMPQEVSFKTSLAKPASREELVLLPDSYPFFSCAVLENKIIHFMFHSQDSRVTYNLE